MKNNNFDYSRHYGNWHSDTPESKRRDIETAKSLFDAHAIYPAQKEARILEIGCGMGRFMLMLRDAGYANLTGIDIDKSQIEIAQKENLNVVLADAAEFLANNTEKYDAIYAFDLLEHIEKERQLPFLKAIFAAASDDGFAVFAVPNALAPLAAFYRYIDFTHTVSYTPITMRFLLNNAGFHHIVVRAQHQETEEVQKLKLPWMRLYRTEFGLNDVILTPNIIAVAFKNDAQLANYLAITPIISNDYAESPVIKNDCAERRSSLQTLALCLKSPIKIKMRGIKRLQIKFFPYLKNCYFNMILRFSDECFYRISIGGE
ncbi:MAG: class I SAM-dependent methyltransferase [Helicobacteraceae bacterium]|jgi:2-polyprenyl-3-methyl-5-hydroxy-6-metoxy-1,4-benzoquinol methylase|nr:class I SAM-dependent methyltransferase [Helicobacteraceae bacterium]